MKFDFCIFNKINRTESYNEKRIQSTELTLCFGRTFRASAALIAVVAVIYIFGKKIDTTDNITENE
jgi:hypothetical protein